MLMNKSPDIVGLRRIFFLLITTCAVSLYAAAVEPPEWFIPLRDAVYEQNLDARSIAPIYTETLLTAQARLEGCEYFTVLSRCEYMMGRALQYEGRKAEAAAHYEKGIEWAKKSLAEGATAEGHQMLAENISQSCAVRSVSWAIANGLKVEEYAKEALKLDPQNTAAQYMIAARYIYAPAPFHNYRRGISMMEDIAAANNAHIPKDDLFNVYLAIGYAYSQQKKYPEAQPWLEKALAIYPSNKFARGLLNT
jgi:tetratricopeptide (TPR) repeat protein